MAEDPASFPLNTYHCICTNLLLATTHDISSLPRRASPAKDNAIILPLPSSRTSNDEEDNSSGSENETMQDVSTKSPRPKTTDVGYSMLVATVQDRRPTMISRQDGFEKRTLFRCGRCKVVVAYKLDGSQFIALAGTEYSEKRADQTVYILPGAMVGTKGMLKGEVPAIEGWEAGDT